MAEAFSALCDRLVIEVRERASAHLEVDGAPMSFLALTPHQSTAVGLTVIDRGDELGLFLMDTVGGWEFTRDDDGLRRLESAARAVIDGKIAETTISYDHTRIHIECAPDPLQFDAVTPPELRRRSSLDRLRSALRPQKDPVHTPY